MIINYIFCATPPFNSFGLYYTCVIICTESFYRKIMNMHRIQDIYKNVNYCFCHGNSVSALTKSNIKIDKIDLPAVYCCRNYTKTHINHASYQILVTALLPSIITSALTAVKDHAIKYSETAFSNSTKCNVNYFLSIKNSSEVIEKLRLRIFLGSQVSSFDFSTLCTALPYDLIKAKVFSHVKLRNECLFFSVHGE